MRGQTHLKKTPKVNEGRPCFLRWAGEGLVLWLWWSAWLLLVVLLSLKVELRACARPATLCVVWTAPP